MIASGFSKIAGRLGLRPRAMGQVVGLGVLQTGFETVAVFMLLPALQFVQAGGQIDRLMTSHSSWSLIVSAFGMIGLNMSLASILLVAYVAIIARQVAQYLQRTTTARVRLQFIADVRQRLFAAFLAADLSAIENEGTGKMLAEYTSETETAATALFLSLQSVVLLSIVSVYLVGLLLLSVPLTLTAIAIMGVTVAILRPVLLRSTAIGMAVSDSNREVSTFLVERLRQLRLVRLAGTEAREKALAAKLLGTQARNQQSAEYLVAKMSSVIEPIFIGFAFGCLWFGAAVLNLGLELLGIFMLIVLRLVPIGKDLMNTRQNVLQTTSALHLVDNTLQRLQAAREVDRGTHTAGVMAPRISLRKVSYSYAGKAPALSNVTLELAAGTMTALVGPSGAGKSTLVDLIPQLRAPSAGQVLFDGQDIKDIRLASLRSSIAYLPQQPQIFDGTIADHVLYGHPGASKEEIRAALDTACCGFVADLPSGLDAPIGEGGSRLSGGQRQRLDLARALLRRAPLLILDEPTSALDAENEKLLVEALERARRAYAPTILVVTHRLKFVAEVAEQIAVLQEGRLVESGTHHDLMCRKGWYAKAWEAQVDRVKTEIEVASLK